MRPNRKLLALILCSTFLWTAGCPTRPPKKTPAEQAYQFRDVFAYPVITAGEGDDAEAARLAPLRDGYLTYIGAKDFPSAAAEFGKVAKRHPDLLEARFLQAISLVLADQPQPALPILEQVVKEAPNYAPAHWWLGKCYFQAGRMDEAMEEMRFVRRQGNLYANEAASVLDLGVTPE